MDSESSKAATLRRLESALAGRYRIERELGAGGMATVYVARDLKHDREVALKVLRAELGAEGAAERFLKEIGIAARLDHPHLLTLIDSGVADGTLYYVVPFVRGESLRNRLAKEGQLPLEDALRITSQLASALEYIHREGVIHRDIKPENILLHEGEAMLGDFGIALALRQGTGDRLTATGLSLGTPQYMSPEQAAGDRQLDARSDVYALAAVLYEMLAGEPPHTGPTVQAVVAKLVSSQPTPLSALRPAVPQGVEEAVMKALAKAPADRYGSAATFSAALAAGAAGKRPVRRGVLVRRAAAAAIGIAAITTLGVWAARSGALGSDPRGVVLRDHAQVTSNQLTQAVGISADDKQLAYGIRLCEAQSCPRALEIAESDGSAARRVVDTMFDPALISWSADRRNLLVDARIAGQDGVHLVSTLGGAARHLAGAGFAAFYGDGDSLLLTRGEEPDSIHWIQIAALDGVPRDSIRVAGMGIGIAAIGVPQSRWIVAITGDASGSEKMRVIDRRGREADQRTIKEFVLHQIRASSDAIWWLDNDQRVLRVALDARTGRLSPTVDTVLSDKLYRYFDVTADGRTLAVEEPVIRTDVYALEFRDLARGLTPPATRIMQGVSSPIQIQISPDGARLLVGPWTRFGASLLARHVYTTPFGGGSQAAIATRGSITNLNWADSRTVYFAERESGKTTFVLADALSGARRAELTTADSLGSTDSDVTPLRDGGWAWIPTDEHRVKVQHRGESAPRVIPMPAWFGELDAVRASPDGERLALAGMTKDSMGVSVVPVGGGDAASWITRDGGLPVTMWLADGSLMVQSLGGPNNGRTFWRVRAPGQAERLGAFAPVDGHPWLASISTDLRRAVVIRGYSGGDLWIWRVNAP